MKTMPTQSQVRYKGNVIQKRVSPGSKSDRVAVLLQTEDQELILRRKDGNPFKDKVLEGLVGKDIEATGVLAGQTLIIKEWEEKG